MDRIDAIELLQAKIEMSHRLKEHDDEASYTLNKGILLSRRETVAIHRLLLMQELKDRNHGEGSAAMSAERDARVKKLEAENDRLLHELSDATWREAKVQGELHRIKEGVRELPVTPVKRTASFESVDVFYTIDVVQKTDLDRLMKGGE